MLTRRQWLPDLEQVPRSIEIEPADVAFSGRVSTLHEASELATGPSLAARSHRSIDAGRATGAVEGIEVRMRGYDNTPTGAPGRNVHTNERYDIAADLIDGQPESPIPAHPQPAVRTQPRAVAVASIEAIDYPSVDRAASPAHGEGAPIGSLEAKTPARITPLRRHPRPCQTSGATMSQLAQRIIELAMPRDAHRERDATLPFVHYDDTAPQPASRPAFEAEHSGFCGTSLFDVHRDLDVPASEGVLSK